MHLPGDLLHKELGQSSCSSSDEIASPLFPGEPLRSRCLRMLLPHSHPTLAVPIAHMWLLHVELVLTEPHEQCSFLWLFFDFDQLAEQCRILLLRHLEHAEKGF